MKKLNNVFRIFVLGLFCMLSLYGCVKEESDSSEIFWYPVLQTVNGFGASSCWTFQELGKIEDESIVEKAIESLYGNSGLRLNIYRYNIGGGSAEAKFDDVYPYNQDWFNKERRAESFFDADKFVDESSFSNRANYDFKKDKYALKMFEKSLEKGNIDKVVFFANSPHYLMTKSQKATGESVGASNLKKEFYSAYCDYLLIIVDELYNLMLKNLETVPKVYISPLNEPQWDWVNAGQEGCFYSYAEMGEFLNVFFNKLSSFNLQYGTSYMAEVYESGSMQLLDNIEYLNVLKESDYYNDINSIAMHSYWSEEINKIYLANLLTEDYKGKSVSVTEFCQMVSGRDMTIDAALYLGRTMTEDFSILKVNEWSWWLALSIYNYNDGLIYLDKEMGKYTLSVPKRYYAMSHFSKYIENGDSLIRYPIYGLSESQKHHYAAFQKTDGSVVVVIVNEGKEAKITLSDEFDDMSIIVTTQTKNLATTKSKYTNTVTIEEKSMTTLILTSKRK